MEHKNGWKWINLLTGTPCMCASSPPGNMRCVSGLLLAVHREQSDNVMGKVTEVCACATIKPWNGFLTLVGWLVVCNEINRTFPRTKNWKRSEWNETETKKTYLILDLLLFGLFFFNFSNQKFIIRSINKQRKKGNEIHNIITINWK